MIHTRIYTKELSEAIGKKVVVAGWVETVRKQGGIIFMILRDRFGYVQLVLSKEHPKAFEIAERLTKESVIQVSGLIVEQPQALGGLELQVEEIDILSKAEAPLPIPAIQKKDIKQSVRLDYRWIDLRDPKKRLIFEMWTLLEQTFTEFFIKRGFIQFHSPTLMSHPSESGAELFELDYFGKKAYLAQSVQAYKQMAIASGFEKVFSIAHVFRAEKSVTRRHSTEIVQYDVEFAFIKSYQEIIALEEEFIVEALTTLKERFGKQVEEFYGVKIQIPSRPFPQLSMAEIKDMLKPFHIETDKEQDLSPAEERKLGELVKERFGHEFVYVTDWHKDERAFYHMRSKEHPELTLGFDLLFKGLEITTGSQREHRYEVLVKQAKEQGLSIEGLSDYLQFFKYGCPPHGGFGFGAARFLMSILEARNIREIDFVTRSVSRLTP